MTITDARGPAIDVVTLGECLIALVAADLGPLAEVGTFHRHVAGAEANVAVGLARLGHRVAFIGRVGDDGFGTAIMRRLRGEGVDVSGLRVEASAPTGFLVRERRGAGPAEVVYHRAESAGSRLEPDDLAAAEAAGLFQDARWLHLTGISPALSSSCVAAVSVAIDIAQRHGMAISLDLNIRRKLWSEAEAATTLRDLVRQCDFVFASRDEATLVSARPGGSIEPPGLLDGRAAAQAIVALGAGTAVITLGGGGAASLTSGGELIHRPATPVLSAVDAVGAGDAFCAGYIAAHLEGRSEGEALSLGNLCGAAVVAAEGDQTGAPTRVEAELLGRLTAQDSIR